MPTLAEISAVNAQVAGQMPQLGQSFKTLQDIANLEQTQTNIAAQRQQTINAQQANAKAQYELSQAQQDRAADILTSALGGADYKNAKDVAARLQNSIEITKASGFTPGDGHPAVRALKDLNEAMTKGNYQKQQQILSQIQTNAAALDALRGRRPTIQTGPGKTGPVLMDPYGNIISGVGTNRFNTPPGGGGGGSAPATTPRSAPATTPRSGGTQLPAPTGASVSPASGFKASPLPYPIRKGDNVYATTEQGEDEESLRGQEYRNSLNNLNFAQQYQTLDDIEKQGFKIDKEKWLWQTGPIGQAQRKFAEWTGDTTYLQLEKDLARVANEIAKAGTTDAARANIEEATGKGARDPALIAKIANEMKADLYGKKLLAQAVNKSAIRFGDANYSAVVADWNKHANRKVFQFMKALEDGVATTEEMTRILGFNPGDKEKLTDRQKAEAVKLQRDYDAIKRMVEKGRLE